MVFGNYAPKIPFNRYLGLRLPWTIRDEDTWKLAHKILGYTSFPIAIIMFIASFFFKIETVSTICVLSWIIIPGLYSFIFYYKKMKGIQL
nr:SdpI family protein [Paeniclostridium ghonii]